MIRRRRSRAAKRRLRQRGSTMRDVQEGEEEEGRAASTCVYVRLSLLACMCHRVHLCMSMFQCAVLGGGVVGATESY